MNNKIFRFRNYSSNINDSCFISIDWGLFTGSIIIFNNDNLYIIDKRFITLLNDKAHLNGLPFHSRNILLDKILGKIMHKHIYIIWEDIFIPDDERSKNFFTILKHEVDWFVQGLLIGLNSSNKCYYINMPCRIMKNLFGEHNEKNGVINFIKNRCLLLFDEINKLNDPQHSLDALFHLFFQLINSAVDELYINKIIFIQEDGHREVLFNKSIQLIKK